MSIVLIGAGELGSRHLQGLATAQSERVIVVEPDAAMRARAEARYGEVRGPASPALELVGDLADVDVVADVGIVATGSLPRRAIVERLVALGRAPKKLVLEKFLFPAVDDYAAVAALLAGAWVSTWVNTPRRRWALYQALRAQLAARPFHMRVEGEAWGLACNAIHFVDAFAYVAGADVVDVEFAGAGDVVDAKRAGYVEMFGVLRARAGAASLTVQCAPGDAARLSVALDVDGHHAVVDERAGVCAALSVQTSAPAFQSKDTGALVNALLADAPCGLPTLSESSAMHVPVLQGFLRHFRAVRDPGAQLCPIT
jgi:hypothetical protein